MPRYTVEVTDRITKWYKEGTKVLHRIAGPAVEFADGTQKWFQHGKYHRTDGPAVEFANGNQYWYQNGLKHRTDGPAIENSNGITQYWINGKQLSKSEFNKRTAPAKELSVAEIEQLLGYKVKVVDK